MAILPKFLRIPKLIIGTPIVDPESGAPTTSFLRGINDSNGIIETAVNTIKGTTDDIAFSLQQAGIAITNAADARALALKYGNEASLVNSYVSPATVLSSRVNATDNTKADLIIANHTRVYGDGTSVAVIGTTLTGLALASNYYVTYQDNAHTGGTVNYNYSMSYINSGQGNGRHLVGNIDTPSTATAPPVVGTPTRPPGTYNCVTVDTMIQLASFTSDGPGDEKRAGDIKVGDLVWTQHNDTKEWGAFPVSAIQFLNRPDVMSAPGYPDATPEHPFWIDGKWGLMLWIGSGAKTAMIAKMTVQDAHTFVSRHPNATTAILSHNKAVSGTNPEQ